MLLPQALVLCLYFVPIPLKWQRWYYWSISVQDFGVCGTQRNYREKTRDSLCLDQKRWFCQELFWMHSLCVQLFFYFSFFSGEEGTQMHTESSSQEAERQTRCQSCTSTFLKLIWRFLIILSVSSSWVGTTQFVKITYETFDCPFFMTWFSTNWNIMVFPIYYSGHLATAQEKQSPIRKFR